MTPEQLEKILKDHDLTLLYFSGPSCNVCEILRPKVEDLIAENEPWHFQYIDTEASRSLAGQYLIFAVPTLLLMAQGQEIARFSRHFGMHELEAALVRYTELVTGSESSGSAFAN